MISSILSCWDRCVTPLNRVKHLPPRLLPYIDDGSTILDVGSGDGRLASLLLRGNPTVSITGVEIVPHPDPHIPIVQYDGTRLPFPDRSFDTVMLIDVLHHDREPDRVVKEAMRVSKHRILIKDHYWVSRPDRMVLSVSDYLGNRAQNVPLPYNFLKLEEWRALFDRLDLEVVQSERFRYSFFDRCKQVIFSVRTIGAQTTGQLALPPTQEKPAETGMTCWLSF